MNTDKKNALVLNSSDILQLVREALHARGVHTCANGVLWLEGSDAEICVRSFDQDDGLAVAEMLLLQDVQYAGGRVSSFEATARCGLSSETVDRVLCSPSTKLVLYTDKKTGKPMLKKKKGV